MPSLGQFIAGHRQRWEQLERLLARANGTGLHGMNAAELEDLARSYREAASDLALLQRDFPDDQITLAVNNLVARAHMRLYRAPPGSWRAVANFFWTDFARRFRAARGYLLLSAALLFLPALWGYVVALLDPTLRDVLVPADLRSIMQAGDTWTDIPSEARPLAASLIFTNNIQVSFLCFAGGVLCGLGTVYVLIQNGLTLGSILGAAQYYGVGLKLGSFISPHGYLELTSIVIAGASGLMLGDALLRPGLLRRRDSLIRAARKAIELVVGTVPVLVVAGLVEGNVSPSELPAAFKIAVGPVLGLVLYVLLFTVGRSRGSADTSARPTVPGWEPASDTAALL